MHGSTWEVDGELYMHCSGGGGGEHLLVGWLVCRWGSGDLGTGGGHLGEAIIGAGWNSCRFQILTTSVKENADSSGYVNGSIKISFRELAKRSPDCNRIKSRLSIFQMLICCCPPCWVCDPGYGSQKVLLPGKQPDSWKELPEEPPCLPAGRGGRLGTRVQGQQSPRQPPASAHSQVASRSGCLSRVMQSFVADACGLSE